MHKHRLLHQYLSAFVPIVGNWAKEIVYVDCLAGPWEELDPNLSDTSFSIGLEVLRRSAPVLNSRGKAPKLRAVLIENKPESFTRLESFASRVDDVDVVVRKWDFNSSVRKILDLVRPGASTFPFFFIDPTGWTEAQIATITPILRVNPGEVLINLMTSWITRFLDDEAKNWHKLVGKEAAAKLQLLSGDEREEELVRAYTRQLRTVGGFDYVCSQPILSGDKELFHFYMIYGTRHPKGVEVFKNAERIVTRFMKETRAEVEARRALERTGQTTFLQPMEAYTERRYTRFQLRNLALAKTEFLKLLKTRKKVDALHAWAEVMQFAGVMESDFQEWIAEQKEAGHLQVLNQKPLERTVKHDDDQVLVWQD